jgi:hypothetical protein
VQLQGRGAHVPGEKQLKSLLSAHPDGMHDYTQLQQLIGFVAWPAYRERMLEALAASIGGVNVDLREKCADALVCLLCSPKHMAVQRSEAANEPGMPLHVASSLQCLWAKFVRLSDSHPASQATTLSLWGRSATVCC